MSTQNLTAPKNTKKNTKASAPKEVVVLKEVVVQESKPKVIKPKSTKSAKSVKSVEAVAVVPVAAPEGVMSDAKPTSIEVATTPVEVAPVETPANSSKESQEYEEY